MQKQKNKKEIEKLIAQQHIIKMRDAQNKAAQGPNQQNSQSPGNPVMSDLNLQNLNQLLGGKKSKFQLSNADMVIFEQMKKDAALKHD